MGRSVDRIGKASRTDGPVAPIAGVRSRSRADRKEDEEAGREDARREHARSGGHPSPPRSPLGPHVDIRA